MNPSFLLQELSEAVHHQMFVFHEAEDIPIERDGRIFVPQDLGERLHVHAALEGAGREGVPQGMKAAVRDM